MKLLTVEQNTTEYSTHWFSAYNRSDFKEYVKINSHLEAAAWTSSYYALLSEKNHKRLTKNKVECFKNYIHKSLKQADTLLIAWNDTPPPLRFLLEETQKWVVLYVGNHLRTADSWSLHNKLGITKKEDETIFGSEAKSALKLLSIQAQFMDDKYLDKRVISAAHRLYEALDIFARPTITTKDLNKITTSLAEARTLSMVEHKEIYSCCSALTEYVLSDAAQPPQAFITELTKDWSESFRAICNTTAGLQAWIKILPVMEEMEEKEFNNIHTDIVTKLETAELRLHRSSLNITNSWLALLT